MVALGSRQVRYPRLYLCFILAAALDAILTKIVLSVGGWEVNSLAATVLHVGGYKGMVYYKFTLVAVTIIICEIVGERKERWGRGLGLFGVAMNCVPIAVSAVLLGLRAYDLSE